MKSAFRMFARAAAIALCASMLWRCSALAQVRMYNVQWTNTAPTMDGVIGAGEWAAAAPAQGNWKELRQPETDNDTANNRFQMMWDASALYLLYQVDQTDWDPAPAEPNPDINFGGDSLNIYFDPNTDNEPNFMTVPEAVVDGYQIAFDQLAGTRISTNANRMGVGVFTEAHIDSEFDDDASWNRGGTSVGGAAMQDVVIAQNNGAMGGIAEMVIPWSNFNADVSIPTGDYNVNTVTDAADYVRWRETLGEPVTNPGEGADGDASGTVDQGDYTVWRANFGTAGEIGMSGLYHASAPLNNEKWYFQIGQITEADPNNALPVYNYTPNDPPVNFFASHPHAEITFVGRPAAGAAIPEPASVTLLAIATIAISLLIRRT